MIRLLFEQRFEDAGGLQPARIGLVAQVLGRGQRQGVESRGLGILGMAARELAHRITVGLDPVLLGGALTVDVQLRGGVDVGALAVGLGADCTRALDRGEPLPDLRRGPESDGERIAPSAERDAPLGHGTGRVDLHCRLERGDCGTELERVEQRHGPVELCLRGRRAGGGEMNGTELFGAPLMMVLRQTGRGEQQQQTDCDRQHTYHVDLLSPRS
jgi:hypothetical protein